jgi:hypothetical protein
MIAAPVPSKPDRMCPHAKARRGHRPSPCLVRSMAARTAPLLALLCLGGVAAGQAKEPGPESTGQYGLRARLRRRWAVGNVDGADCCFWVVLLASAAIVTAVVGRVYRPPRWVLGIVPIATMVIIYVAIVVAVRLTFLRPPRHR